MGLFGGDDDEEEDVVDEEGGDPLLDDGGGDDLLDGGDDLEGDDMAFGDMDDEETGGAATSELENRMDELENEVGSLSSTVNTVKSENEQISESVDDIEENIRKLLEVYEMVTRGVNPFVNENELGDAFDGGAGGAGGGGMSLFGDDDEEPEEDLDESVAGADAEEFFDEDLGEGDADGGDEFGGMDDLDDGGDEFGGMDDLDDGGDGFDGMDDLDDGGDEFGGMDDLDDGGDGDGDDEGKSFEELKAEYESGEADWNAENDVATADETPEAPDDGPADTGIGASSEPEMDVGAEPDLDQGPDLEPDTASDGTAASDGTTDTNAAQAAGVGRPDGESRRPHLAVLPDGYASDVVVMEWLEFLVDRGGVDGAARTIAYYESIGWLGDAAAEDLQTFLSGFGEPADRPDPETVEPHSPLSVQCHRTSLQYVSRLSRSSMGVGVMDRLEERQGGATAPTRSEPPRPDWVETNGHGAPTPAADAATGPATDGGAPQGDDGPGRPGPERGDGRSPRDDNPAPGHGAGALGNGRGGGGARGGRDGGVGHPDTRRTTGGNGGTGTPRRGGEAPPDWNPRASGAAPHDSDHAAAGSPGEDSSAEESPNQDPLDGNPPGGRGGVDRSGHPGEPGGDRSED